MGDCPIARSAGVSRQGEKLIPARLLPSAGHRRQRSLSRLTRRWNRRRFAPRLSAQVVRRMRDRIVTNSVTRHLLRVGNTLLSGPESIYPVGGDGHSYVWSTVSMRWHSQTFSEWRSVRVYCDANGSDDEGYLEPMVRFASWDRENDILRVRPPWPNVLVELEGLPIDSLDLQAVVRRLQEALAQVPIVAHGLPTRRNFGEFSGDQRGH